MHLTKSGIVPAIDGNDARSPPFHLKAEPAVPGADIENPLPAKVGRNGKLCDPVLQALQTTDSLNHRSVRQLKAVPPASGGPFLMPFPDFVESVRRAHKLSS